MPINQLQKSLWLLLMVIGALLISSLVPAFKVGSLDIKRADLLADIKTDPPPVLTEVPIVDSIETDSIVDSVIQVKPAPKAEAFPCPDKNCLQDFSPNKSTLKNFFRALQQANRRQVRIAFYGDSFIEGDVLCGSFRDTLQGLYGGRGVGFVPIASEVAQYRTSIQHSYSNWEAYSLVGKQSPQVPLGISGHAFIPLPENVAEFKPPRRPANKKFDRISLFYKSELETPLHYLVNDTLTINDTLPASHLVNQVMLQANQAASIKLSFPNPDSVIAYGINFDTETGVLVDNLAMRGNSGIGLYGLDTTSLKQFDQYLNYKLILLQYGLNVVTETDSSDYTWYVTRMVKVVNRIKAVFPGASIVLIGISDRAGNQNGKILTIPAIARMRKAQLKIAQRTQIAYWDLFEAMGGENSIVKFAEAKPPQAAKDFTHLTFLGGRRLAKKLTDALLFERTRYDKKPDS
jgi:lysophospholipase L1-like esterase